ncbi:MAG: adenylyl-sulfate kinase [Burkholderiales bacterium]
MKEKGDKSRPGVVSTNITWYEGKVSAADRKRLLRQEAATIWLTGLSGSGKSTIAFELEKQLVVCLGHAAYALDGDNVRHGLNRDLGFTPEDRTENIRRVAEVARLFNEAGVFVITAFISPYRADREMARTIIGPERFIETHIAAELDICEKRDPKGLYRKARAGQMSDFTGISAPYEAPTNPNLRLNTGTLTVNETLDEILRHLAPRFRER